MWIVWTLWRSGCCEENTGSRVNWSTVVTQGTKLCYSWEDQILRNLKNNSICRCVRKIAQNAVYFFMSVCPHGTTRLPLDEFSWKFYLSMFRKTCQGNSSFINIWQRITGTWPEYKFTFMITSRWILLKIRNVSDKSCRIIQNTHFTFNFFFFRKSCRLWHDVEKYCRVRLTTDKNIACMHCMNGT
jgi:hypothetical protein